ncbi:PRC-barrel domain-containing protein [Bradyrhizobium lablabi]|uniref:PRC-barrel domain-containing protein n=1 Tax=Bradyrhizobium lablabi TaxID=722472 RepID=A0A1M7AN27_9BRAD|nr:PRC-barrel domain-containing protein [Bradyrhizobium lablabi]SHL44075.1 PRC-barrel domain-containing protein [Bradyrhizobium lablabi]
MVTEARETGSLIGSDKAEGTAVYGADDTKIGKIERVMIDKMSGRVSYAVLKGAPKYSNDNSWNWSDSARARAVNDCYGVGIV